MTLARLMADPVALSLRDFLGDDTALGAWTPRLDVIENEKEYLVTVDLPGVDKSDARVTLENKVLTISGEKKEEHEDKRENYHRIERSYGRFSRSVYLEKEVDAENVDANFRNGVLRVTAPKTRESRSKEITIKT